ncbi:MAG TPA: cupin domain-containing protein [Acidimicrobiia bacterium]|nr:cupin domain-containing protein [Acidimicrobiia bacterium]
MRQETDPPSRRSTYPRGEVARRHFHQKTNHSWYVIEGGLGLSVGGESHDSAPGGFAPILGGTSHAFANAITGDARRVELTTPGGFDRYLDELAEAFPTGADLDPKHMVEIMARHETCPVRP